MNAPHTPLSQAELECLAEMQEAGELDDGAPEYTAPRKHAPDRPIAGRRDVSAAQNVRNSAPLFVTLDGLELMKLRRFPGWVRWLFLELCAACDFKTGELATSYAKLQALLSCDQPRQGGQRLPVPSIQQIRRALDDLEAADMLARDREFNVKANGGRGILFLSVGRREKFGTAKANRDRSCDRVERKEKRKKINKLEKGAAGVAAGVATGVPGAVIPSPISPSEPGFSTGARPRPPEPDHPPGPIAVGDLLGAATPKIAPPGGVISPQAGTPPRASITARAMRERVRKIAPPGGEPDAPQAGTEQPPPSARIRRPRKPVLNEGGRPISEDNTSTEQGREATE